MAITHMPVAAGHDEEVDHHELSSHSPHPAQSGSLHHHSISNASTATVDIEAWTVAALESLSIAPIARGTGNALSIPLDGVAPSTGGQRELPLRHGAGGSGSAAAEMKLRGVAFGDDDGQAAYGANITPPRRPPSRRDSMRRRDALLKGKEGSRQRRRWENDRLVHVPNVVPPLPSDWQICPTHRVLPPVPYQLAQYWDKGLRERAQKEEEAKRRKQKQKQKQRQRNSSKHGCAPAATDAIDADADAPDVGVVPRDLRNTAKRTPAVKSWLRVLEEPVREFVVERGLAVAAAASPAGNSGKNGSSEGGVSDESDSDNDDGEEIVFMGRNGRNTMDGKPWKRAQRYGPGQQPGEEEKGMVLEMEEGGGGAFKFVSPLSLHHSTFLISP
ncbi:hypothetical protein VTI28DRAFT_3512 [Corynascus sepedonium]